MSRGTEGAGYSYYGSAANNGGVTNATAETALVTPANPKVVLTGEGKESMEDYYVTMKDLMVDSFFYEENTWALSEGVYKTENADIDESAIAPEMLTSLGLAVTMLRNMFDNVRVNFTEDSMTLYVDADV